MATVFRLVLDSSKLALDSFASRTELVALLGLLSLEGGVALCYLIFVIII